MDPRRHRVGAQERGQALGGGVVRLPQVALEMASTRSSWSGATSSACAHS